MCVEQLDYTWKCEQEAPMKFYNVMVVPVSLYESEELI